MIVVFYREAQRFQPDYGRAYTEPGLTKEYRSFATEVEAEAAVAELEADEDIYNAWYESVV